LTLRRSYSAGPNGTLGRDGNEKAAPSPEPLSRAQKLLPAMAPATVTPAAVVTRAGVAVVAVVVRPPPAPAPGVTDPADLIDVGDRVRRQWGYGHGGSSRDQAAEQQRGGACELEFGHVRFLSGSSPLSEKLRSLSGEFSANC